MKKIIISLALILLTFGLNAQKAKNGGAAKSFGKVAVVVDACSYEWTQNQYDYIKSTEKASVDARAELFDFVVKMLKEEACNVLNDNQNEYDKIQKTKDYDQLEELLNDYYPVLQKQKADYLLVVECSEWVEESQFHTQRVHCDWIDLKNNLVRSTDFKGNRIDENASNAAVFQKNSKLAIQKKLRQFVRNQVALNFNVSKIEGKNVSLVTDGPFVTAQEGDIFSLYELTDAKATIAGQKVLFKIPHLTTKCRFVSMGKNAVVAETSAKSLLPDGLVATYSDVVPPTGKIFSRATFVPMTYDLSKCSGWVAKRINNVIKTTLCEKNGVVLSIQTGRMMTKSANEHSDSIVNFQVVVENFKLESQQLSLDVVVRNSMTNHIVKKVTLTEVSISDLEARVESALDNLFFAPCAVSFPDATHVVIYSEAMMNCPEDAYFKILKITPPSGKSVKMSAVPKELPIDLKLVKQQGPMLECVVFGDMKKVPNNLTSEDSFVFVTNSGPSVDAVSGKNLPAKADSNAKRRM